MSIRLTLSALLVAGALASSAQAFEIDQGQNGNPAARLADPDTKVPFPHLDDQGQPAGTAMDSGGVHFNISGPTTSQDSGRDNFQRAQQNQMGQ